MLLETEKMGTKPGNSTKKSMILKKNSKSLRKPCESQQELEE